MTTFNKHLFIFNLLSHNYLISEISKELSEDRELEDDLKSVTVINDTDLIARLPNGLKYATADGIKILRKLSVYIDAVVKYITLKSAIPVTPKQFELIHQFPNLRCLSELTKKEEKEFKEEHSYILKFIDTIPLRRKMLGS